MLELNAGGVEFSEFTGYMPLTTQPLPPIPKEKFESLRAGVWVSSVSSKTLGGPEDLLFFKIDQACRHRISPSEVDDRWKHLSCEFSGSGGNLTWDSWWIWLAAYTEAGSRPEDSMSWLVDSVSIEVCLK